MSPRRRTTRTSRPAPRHATAAGPRRSAALFFAALLCVGAVVYSPSLAGPFISDDNVYLAFKDFSFDDMPGTGLPLDWLVEQIEACKADEKLLLLDLVHTGRGGDLDRQPSLPELIYQLKTPIHSVDIIGSAGEGQRGNILPAERQGAFAHFVAQGFAGDADTDRDLVITGDELEAYLTARFADLAFPSGADQQPFRMEAQSSGSD